jgi:hypothetical protein
MKKRRTSSRHLQPSALHLLRASVGWRGRHQPLPLHPPYPGASPVLGGGSGRGAQQHHKPPPPGQEQTVILVAATPTPEDATVGRTAPEPARAAADIPDTPLQHSTHAAPTTPIVVGLGDDTAASAAATLVAISPHRRRTATPPRSRSCPPPHPRLCLPPWTWLGTLC